MEEINPNLEEQIIVCLDHNKQQTVCCVDDNCLQISRLQCVDCFFIKHPKHSWLNITQLRQQLIKLRSIHHKSLKQHYDLIQNVSKFFKIMQDFFLDTIKRLNANIIKSMNAETDPTMKLTLRGDISNFTSDELYTLAKFIETEKFQTNPRMIGKRQDIPLQYFFDVQKFQDDLLVDFNRISNQIKRTLEEQLSKISVTPAQNIKLVDTIQLHGVTLARENGPIYGLSFLSPVQFITCGQQKSIIVRNRDDGKALLMLPLEHQDTIQCVLPLNSAMIATASADQTIQLWDIDMEQCVHTFFQHTDRVLRLAKINENTFASCSQDCTIRFWDWLARRCVFFVPLKEFNRATNLMSLTNDLLVAATMDGKATIWSVQEKRFQFLMQGHQDSAMALCSLNDDEIAVGGSDQDTRIIIYDWKTEKMKRYMDGHSDWVQFIVSVNFQIMVSGSSDGKLVFWNHLKLQKIQIIYEALPLYIGVLDGDRLLYTKHSGQVQCLQFQIE